MEKHRLLGDLAFDEYRHAERQARQPFVPFSGPFRQAKRRIDAAEQQQNAQHDVDRHRSDLRDRIAQLAEVAHERDGESQNEAPRSQTESDRILKSEHDECHRAEKDREQQRDDGRPREYDRLVPCQRRQKLLDPHPDAEYKSSARKPEYAEVIVFALEIASEVEHGVGCDYADNQRQQQKTDLPGRLGIVHRVIPRSRRCNEDGM
ncbi:hypothetical protein [Cohnella rhizosphaerae]|uniref:Uncharacterized protein n=1 Tax=Cohnella rhizosphaerae TaxID=1457232 RepID=A0A9X4KRF7_9BACL|nr:hypothetical protein [Cohnella rhizosphaerae]MDG0809749.1 hypothetical protein [Cohnella rhizosphaerae]